MPPTIRSMVKPRVSMMLVLLSVLLSLTPRPALAAEVRGRDAIVIDSGTTVDDDLYVFGRTVDIRSTVNGDVIAGAATVIVSGVVNGDLLTAAGTIEVPGRVLGSIRAAGGNLLIGGAVQDDVVLGGGRLTISPAGRIGRDLLFGGGSLTMNGEVARNIRIGGGEATLGGHVDGDVRADVDRLTVADGAMIGGDLTYTAEQAGTIAPGATVAGQTQRLATPDTADTTPLEQLLAGVVGWLRLLVAFLLVGVALVLLFPAFSGRAADSLHRSPWPSVGIGLALLIGVPLLAVAILIAGIFVGGWWLSPILLGVFAAILVLGYVIAALLVGRTILHQLGRGAMHPVLGLATGLAILLLFGVVPILGWTAGIVMAVAGLGALARTVWHARGDWPTVAPA